MLFVLTGKVFQRFMREPVASSDKRANLKEFLDALKLVCPRNGNGPVVYGRVETPGTKEARVDFGDVLGGGAERAFGNPSTVTDTGNRSVRIRVSGRRYKSLSLRREQEVRPQVRLNESEGFGDASELAHHSVAVGLL